MKIEFGLSALAAAILIGMGEGVKRPEPVVIRIEPPRATLEKLLQAGDYPAASQFIERQLTRTPDDPVLLYNAACVETRLGRNDAGANHLMNAIRHGFRDFSWIQRDPDLIDLRPHPVYRALIDARNAADSILASRQIDSWLERLGADRYRLESDARYRLNFLLPIDMLEPEITRAMIEDHLDRLTTLLFELSRDNSVQVIIVDEMEADETWDNGHIHGEYRHNRRELICRNTSTGIRHELVHMLHHHHMDAIGQNHAMWIQEGLASLWEDYEINRDGSVSFSGGRQHAIAKELRRRDLLIPWNELFEYSKSRFDARAAQLYPQVRSIFMFVAEHDDISHWYHTYFKDFETDPTGRLTLEAMFSLPIDEIEDRWLHWLDSQPVVITQDMVKPAESDRP